MQINSCINELIAAITDTSQFEKVIRTKRTVTQNKDHKALIENFMDKQNVLYSGGKSENEIEKLLNELEYEYSNISKIKEIEDYLSAGDQFNTLVSEIIHLINSGISEKLTK